MEKTKVQVTKNAQGMDGYRVILRFNTVGQPIFHFISAHMYKTYLSLMKNLTNGRWLTHSQVKGACRSYNDFMALIIIATEQDGLEADSEDRPTKWRFNSDKVLKPISLPIQSSTPAPPPFPIPASPPVQPHTPPDTTPTKVQKTKTKPKLKSEPRCESTPVSPSMPRAYLPPRDFARCWRKIKEKYGTRYGTGQWFTAQKLIAALICHRETVKEFLTVWLPENQFGQYEQRGRRYRVRPGALSTNVTDTDT